MRWERLFADLEARLEADERMAHEAGVTDLVRSERAQLTLADRLGPHLDAELSWQLAGAPGLETPIRAVLLDAGADWLLLETVSPGTSAIGAALRSLLLIPARSVIWVGGLTRAARHDEREVFTRLGLTVILRGLSRDRCAVRVLTAAGELTGTIDRVGADHVDLALHGIDVPRRAGQVHGVRCVPLAAVAAIALSDDSI